MLRAENRAIILAVLNSVERALALFDHGTYGVHVLFAAGKSATVKHLALLPANAAHFLTLCVAIILDDGPGIHWLGNAEAFEARPDITQQPRANAMHPARVLTAALEETAPARAQVALDGAKRLLLYAQHARPRSILSNATVILHHVCTPFMHRRPAATTAAEQPGAPQLTPIFVVHIEVAEHARIRRKLIWGKKGTSNKMQHSAAGAVLQNSG
jgi:hypothetical protein